MTQRIYITGMGICCPLGNSLEECITAIQNRESGIRPIQSFDCSRLTMRHAAEVYEIPQSNLVTNDRFRTWDRGTRMAMHAAEQALIDAHLNVNEYPPHRVGLCIGTSGSGQYQNARFRLDRKLPVDRQMAFFLSRNSPHYQSSELATALGVKGPNLAIGAATAGGGIALATALAWLRLDYVDAVIVGGSESFSLLNVLGFDQLGLTIPRPCTPFSGEPGMTFGEGAGYVVLETEVSLQRRGATPHAELASVIVRADGFDPILFDPSGGGLSRAMKTALADADCSTEDIDWIRASGTGGRDQDLAETIAIKSVFPSPPAVSSLEPYLGHANGAGPAINLVATVLCMKADMIPATLGFDEPRIGCDLDYVQGGHRRRQLDTVLCNTMAFGGTNCSIVLKSVASRLNKPSVRLTSSNSKNAKNDTIVVTGVGIISPAGCGQLDIAEKFKLPVELQETQDRFSADELRNISLVKDFSARKLCPLVKLRGTELLTQYAAAAVALALQDAGRDKVKVRPDRSGVITAISRTSGSVFERLFSELQLNGFRPLVGRLMLRNGRFMIASQLSNWFDLQGFSSTLSLGVGAGLHALIAGYQQLLSDSSLDSMVVVAADELSDFTLRSMRAGGQLAEPGSSLNRQHPCCHTSSNGKSKSYGFKPGEGAVALVLERKSVAEERHANILCEIAGANQTFDAQASPAKLSEAGRATWEAFDPNGQMFAAAMQGACHDASIPLEEVDLFQGNASGIDDWDQKEKNAQRAMLSENHRWHCVNANLGFLEASSSLVNLTAAINWMQERKKNVHDRTAVTVSSLVASSTEQGHNAAVVLRA